MIVTWKWVVNFSIKTCLYVLIDKESTETNQIRNEITLSLQIKHEREIFSSSFHFGFSLSLKHPHVHAKFNYVRNNLLRIINNWIRNFETLYYKLEKWDCSLQNTRVRIVGGINLKSKFTNFTWRRRTNRVLYFY